MGGVQKALLEVGDARRRCRSAVACLKMKMSMAEYIAKFLTKKKYGISYGDFGLVSFASFLKVNIG